MSLNHLSTTLQPTLYLNPNVNNFTCVSETITGVTLPNPGSFNYVKINSVGNLSTASSVNANTDINGILPVQNGGSGNDLSLVIANDFLKFDGTKIVDSGVLTTNVVLKNGPQQVINSQLNMNALTPSLLLALDASKNIVSIANPAGIINYAEFFALMPGDNAATIAVNAPVLFPQNGVTDGVILRNSAGVFNIPAVGTYMYDFQVSVTEAGQLIVVLAGAEVAKTVVGRATGTSQICGTGLITTVAPNSTFEVRNASGNAAALTITPTAGGTHSVGATLRIQRIR